MAVLVKRKKKAIKECDAGAMGNQSSNSCIGSGDLFGGSAKMAVQSKIKVRKRLTKK